MHKWTFCSSKRSQQTEMLKWASSQQYQRMITTKFPCFTTFVSTFSNATWMFATWNGGYRRTSFTKWIGLINKTEFFSLLTEWSENTLSLSVFSFFILDKRFDIYFISRSNSNIYNDSGKGIHNFDPQYTENIFAL